MPISLSQRTRRLLAPTGFVHAAMPSLIANAQPQATWLSQSMQNHQMALSYDSLVKKNYGVDPLRPHHSIYCTALAVSHSPTPPPFPGHVSLIHAVHTIGARVDALQLRHVDLFRRVYALPDMIRCTFVSVPLDIVQQNVLSLRWQPMMLFQLQCGTKLDNLKLLNSIRHVQHAPRHHLPVCVEALERPVWAELHFMELPVALVKPPPHLWVWHPYKHMVTMLSRNFMPIICLIERLHTDFKGVAPIFAPHVTFSSCWSIGARLSWYLPISRRQSLMCDDSVEVPTCPWLPVPIFAIIPGAPCVGRAMLWGAVPCCTLSCHATLGGDITAIRKIKAVAACEYYAVSVHTQAHCHYHYPLSVFRCGSFDWGKRTSIVESGTRFFLFFFGASRAT